MRKIILMVALLLVPVTSAAGPLKVLKQRSFLGLEAYREWQEQDQSLFKRGTLHQDKVALVLNVRFIAGSDLFGKVGTQVGTSGERPYFTQVGLRVGKHF